jgi:galactofuranose transport system permease protein
VMAISASVAAVMMNPVIIGLKLPPDLMKFINDPNFTYSPLWEVILGALLIATLCGLWNGMLVAYGKIQPMVATLILMIAGRGIAQLITNGVRIQIFYEPYAFLGQGWFILPFSLYIVVVLFTLAWLLTRKTAIGLYIESVGINARSSLFSGIDQKKVKLLAYIFCGFCAGIAGLVASSNIKTSDAFNMGVGMEMDAILAVLIGGTVLGVGGRFSLLASIIGAMVIQAITTSMYALGIPAFALQAIKGVFVIFVILLYSQQMRNFVRKISSPKEV